MSNPEKSAINYLIVNIPGAVTAFELADKMKNAKEDMLLSITIYIFRNFHIFITLTDTNSLRFFPFTFVGEKWGNYRVCETLICSYILAYR